MTWLITMHSYLPHKAIYVGDDREIRFPTRLFKGNERIKIKEE